MKQKQSFRKPKKTDCILEYFNDEVEQKLNKRVQKLSKKNNTQYLVLYRYRSVQVVTVEKQQEWNEYCNNIKDPNNKWLELTKYSEPLTEIKVYGYRRVILQDTEGTIKRCYYNWNRWINS